jgi:hypothetical protein
VAHRCLSDERVPWVPECGTFLAPGDRSQANLRKRNLQGVRAPQTRRVGNVVLVDDKRTARLNRILWISAIIFGLAAIWLTTGLWSVHVSGQSVGCGSPFMGRYVEKNPDLFDPAFRSCFLQAPHRRELAWIFLSGGLLLVMAAVLDRYLAHRLPRRGLRRTRRITSA